MKNLNILASIALLLAISSCQKEPFTPDGTDVQLITVTPEFSASISESQFKTTVDASTGIVSWEDSDEITVTDANAKKATYQVTKINEESGIATFNVKGTPDAGFGTAPFSATYGSEPSAKQVYSATAGKLYMTAAPTSGTRFTFSVKTGLMKINLKKEGESIKKITVTGTPTGGSETSYVLDCSNEGDGVNISSGADFFIALPEGNYSRLCFDNAKLNHCIVSPTSDLAVVANHIKPISLSSIIQFSFFLKGEFSVSSTKKVKFTSGNLYWNGSEWRLESHQYDYKTSWDEKHVDHLFWTDSEEGSRIKTADGTLDKASTTPFFSQGQNKIKIQGISELYVLTKDEWDYLLTNHTNKAGVKVAGIEGCWIIAPDGFSGSIEKSYSADEWAVAEEKYGLLCLLNRGGYRKNGTTTYENTTSQAYYWSSTSCSDPKTSAWDVEVLNSRMQYGGKDRARYVRLVATI